MSATSEFKSAVRNTVPHFSRIAAFTMVPFALIVSAAAATFPRDPKPGSAIPRVSITTRDFAYDAPDTIAAGYTEFVMHNLGPEMHHIQFMRLEGGHTLADLMAAMKTGAPPAWAIEAGGPNAPVPGGTSTGIVKLRAGRYVMLCLIPSADGVPHVMKGMSKEFVVKPNTKNVAAPIADVKVVLNDYNFVLPKMIAAGKHMIAVSNAAASPQHHEMFIGKLAPGKTAHDLAMWAEKQDGPPPGMPIGGTTGLNPGQTMYVPLDLTPGEYALLCFLPDAKDGKAHVAHGMLQTFTVR